MSKEFVHSILIDDDEQPEGWRVWCVPHGYIATYPTRTEAVLRGLEHDVEYGGESCR
jgi:hypothetical protein